MRKIVNEEISVSVLVREFRNMADRGTLLVRGNLTQEDLLIQIIGTISVVSMRNHSDEMKPKINTVELIQEFENMAKRQSLLVRGPLTQYDVLCQIIGTIVLIASRGNDGNSEEKKPAVSLSK